MHENEVISEITETTIDRIITILQDRHVILDDNLLLSGIVRNDYELITSGYTSGLCDTSAFTLDFEETGIDSNKLYFELPKDHINPMFKNVELNTIYASSVSSYKHLILSLYFISFLYIISKPLYSFLTFTVSGKVISATTA